MPSPASLQSFLRALRRGWLVLGLLLLAGPAPAVAQTSGAPKSSAAELSARLQSVSANTPERVNLLNALTKAQIAETRYAEAAATARESVALSESIGYALGRVESVNALGLATRYLNDFPGSQKLHREALVLAAALPEPRPRLQAEILLNLAIALDRSGSYLEALEALHKALPLAEADGDLNLRADVLNATGRALSTMGRTDEAIEIQIRTLHLREQTGDLKGEATALSDIGNSYLNIERNQESFDFHLRSLRIREQIGDRRGQAISASNIGWCLHNLNRLDEAVTYLRQSLSICTEIGDKSTEAAAWNNLGLVQEKAGDLPAALDSQERCLSIAKEIGSKYLMGWAYYAEASVRFKQKNLADAAKICAVGFPIAEESGDKDLLRRFLELQAEIQAASGDHAAAYATFRRFVEVKDEIFNEASDRKIADAAARYESERKNREIAMLQQESQIQMLQLGRADLLRNSLVAGFVLALVLAFTIHNRFRLQRRAEIEARRRSDELAAAYAALREKNTEMLDSIAYARTIQQAILPDIEQLRAAFPAGHFLLHRPKDIVSGDFHWLHRSDSGVVFLAVCDCTGHGVPGACMSMIGDALLTQAIVERGLTDPAVILADVHFSIRRALRQDELSGDAHDGMDVALVRWEPGVRRLAFAGARRPLHLALPGVGENGLLELRGDRNSIGGRQRSTDEQRQFTTHVLEIPSAAEEPWPTLYLHTDGLADQCGPDRRSLGTRRLRELLASVAPYPPAEQAERLSAALAAHQRTEAQRDDILLLSVRL